MKPIASNHRAADLHARSRRHDTRTRALIALLAPLTACAASPAPPPPRPTSLAEWRAAHAHLAELRRLTQRPRTLRVALHLREPRTGRTLEARGAVAIDPAYDATTLAPNPARTTTARGALRMILLGPGGTTALDLWLAGDSYRFAVPALDLLRRGDATTPLEAQRGLPIAFLRAWLLHPAEGTLLWAARDADAERFILRDGPAIIDLTKRDDGRIDAHRATWSTSTPPRLLDEERITADAIGCARATYHQTSTSLTIEIRCESEDLQPPNPRAFLDPDAPSPERGTP